MGYPVIAATPSKPCVLVRTVNRCACSLMIVRVRRRGQSAVMAGI